MNRGECKNQAKACLSETDRQPKIVSLVFLLGAAVILVLRYFVLEAVGNMDTGGQYLSQSVTGASKMLVISYAVAIVFQILLVLLCAGYTAVALELRNKNAVAPGSLLAGFRMGRPVLILYLLTVLYIGLWAYAFAMPLCYLLIMDAMGEAPVVTESMMMTIMLLYFGIVMFFTSYRYRMSLFLLMDNPGMGARNALRQAVRMNRGYRVKLFFLDLSFLPWILLGVVTCGVMLVAKLPYIVTSYACAYQAILEEYIQKQERIKEIMTQRPPM